MNNCDGPKDRIVAFENRGVPSLEQRTLEREPPRNPYLSSAAGRTRELAIWSGNLRTPFRKTGFGRMPKFPKGMHEAQMCLSAFLRVRPGGPQAGRKKGDPVLARDWIIWCWDGDTRIPPDAVALKGMEFG